MALFGRARGRKPRVLTAAGTRIDLTNREAVRRLAVTRNAQTWQSDAWAYRDMIGELRFAGQYKSRAVSRVRFFPAAIIPDQDEPLPFDADEVDLSPALMRAAEEEMARLPLDAGYRFLGVLDENLTIAGEAWLRGYHDEAREEQWEVLSVSEVILGQDGQVSIRRAGEGVSTPIDIDNEELLRLWVPHPRWGNLADSPMRALQDVCEAIILAGQEQRAVARSRVASNGMLKIPRGLSLLLATRDDEVTADSDAFMAELTAALTAPIANEGHPSSVAPVGVIGEIEDLKAFEHMRIDREASADIIQKVEQNLARLARGLDIAPEIITGMGDANHWSAWQIDSSTYRYHIDPSVRTVADALTEAFLRPALMARNEGFTLADVRQVTIWRDAGVLTENPNRGQDAKDAFDRGGIGFKALNNALGFSDADMPDDDELIKMIAVKVGVDTSTSALLLRAALGTAVPEQPQPVVVQAERTDPQLGPGTTPPTGEDATPATQPTGVTAGGRLLADALVAAMEPSDTHQLQPELSRALADIDRALMDRFLVAAEEALARGLEKAGARVRSHAVKDKDLRATLTDVPVHLLAAQVGREGCLKLGVRETDLLAGVFDRLKTNWDSWVAAAVAESVRITLRLLGLQRNTPQAQAITATVTRTMAARTPEAWAWLNDQLTAHAERALFNPQDVDDTPGERSHFHIPAGVVRQALAMVGGPHPATNGDRPQLPGGIGTGGTITDTLQAHGAATLGFEWIYGPYERNTFEPHLDLDGERFGSWNDERLTPPTQYAWVGPYFHPGDHNGCMCAAMPMWVTPTNPEPDLSETGRRGIADRLRSLRDRWLRRARG